MLVTAIVIGAVILLGLFGLRLVAGLALTVVRLILAVLVIAFVVTLVLALTD